MSPIHGVGSVGGLQYADGVSQQGAAGFADNLDALLRPVAPVRASTSATGVQFSKHANARMESRGITLDEQDLQDLSGAIDNLARRGAKESLVLMGDHAFIVGVPDRRIVTVMTRSEAAGNIFTQIDSTAVVR